MPADATRYRHIEVEQVGDVTVVTLTDKRILEESQIEQIGDELFHVVDDEGKRKLLIQWKKVECMSGLFLGELITLNKKIRSISGQLKLCRIKAEIYEVFEMTKLNKVFKIHATEEEALEAFT